MIVRYAMSTAFLAGSSRAFRVRTTPAWISLASFSLGRSRTLSTPASCSAAAVAVDGGDSRVTRDLHPQPLWRFFEEISAIPRASKHEAAVLGYVKRFAEDRGLPWREDAAGNVVIERGGTDGGEAAETVVIQGHVDMVTEKNAGSSHDFLVDPIRLVVDEDWLTADSTTLGADNGIGVAAALTLLDSRYWTPTALSSVTWDPFLEPYPRGRLYFALEVLADVPASSGVTLPPLECLFTVEEEIGLVGAFALDESMIKGRTMLNLDTVEWGSLFVGCAGGGDTLISLPIERDTIDPESYAVFRVAVEGLMGGHSGINIHEDRGNSIKLLVRVLESLLEDVPSLRLVDLWGGDKHNAIPREAFASVLLPKDGEASAFETAKDSIARVSSDLRSEFGTKEASLSVLFESVGGGEGSCLRNDVTRRLLSLLSLLPHGALKMSHDLEGLVETSSNLASVAPITTGVESGGSSSGGEYSILCSTRSSVGSALESVRRRIKTAAELCGASNVVLKPAYPGWKPDLDSNVLKVARDSLRDLLGDREPIIAALHAGLECGVIGDKAPGMDMVSFGPTIEGAHSPDEKVEIASVEKFWQLVLATLERLAKGSRE